MSKVAIARCASYETRAVQDAVRRAVDLVGGMASYVRPGAKVLLKPNLLSPRPPEDAVDTHPEVVRAVARLVKESGGTPVIGDSPGGYGDNIEEIFTASGMREMAKEEGVELVRFKASRYIQGVPISRHVFDCDVFISIPKFKTHIISVLTAALKNTYGAIVGIYKAECHSKAPKEEDFAKMIAHIHSLARPHLNILDGIVAMEGDGPSSGRPRRMELVMASADAVALDSCLAIIMGLEPDGIHMIREAAKIRLGESDAGRIEITGDDIAGFVKRDFKLPQTSPLKVLPKGMLETLAKLVVFKPFIDPDVCNGCNLCKLTCPVGAITSDGDRCKVDYAKCVRCMCCHEVCPYRAISVKRNIVAKWVWG